MKLSQIKNLFNKTETAETFSKQIASEVSIYKNLVKKKGSSIPIMLDEDIQLSIGPEEVYLLCDLFSKNELTEHEIAYITDAFSLSDKISYTSDRISDLVAMLTDPEINGGLTYDLANEIMSTCRNLR